MSEEKMSKLCPSSRLRDQSQFAAAIRQGNHQESVANHASSSGEPSNHDDDDSDDSPSKESQNVVNLRSVRRNVRRTVFPRGNNDYLISDGSDDELFEGFGPEDEDQVRRNRLSEVIVFLESGDLLINDTSLANRDDCFSDDGDFADDPFQRELRGAMAEPTMSLHAACVRGHTKELRRWKMWKMGCCGRKMKDDTPLHCAARAGDVATVEDLLAQGASWSQTNYYDHSPLELAARHGHKGVVKALLKHGAAMDPEEIERAYEATKSWGVVQTLHTHDRAAMKRTPDEDAEKSAPWVNQLMFRVVQKGRVHMLNGLLGMGANVNCTGILGWTPLQIAARRGHVRCVAALLACGADVTATDELKWTALHYAAREGRVDIVKLLLKAGADVYVKCGSGRTPLELATDAATRHLLESFKKR